jgi:hypothetical protein
LVQNYNIFFGFWLINIFQIKLSKRFFVQKILVEINVTETNIAETLFAEIIIAEKNLFQKKKLVP